MRKSVEERVHEIDEKIAYHREQIKKLEDKKLALLNPQPTMKNLAGTIRKRGLSVDEVIEMLDRKDHLSSR